MGGVSYIQFSPHFFNCAEPLKSIIVKNDWFFFSIVNKNLVVYSEINCTIVTE